MPRQARVTPGGLAYHVLNRAVAGLPLFRKEADYEAFERIMTEAHGLHPTRIVAWCLMQNHWHFVLWPREEGEVTAFMRWLTHTHAMRWHVAHGTVGRGHLYQGRFKSFPIQEDEHFLTVCRYVERNALTAGVADRAEDWRWGSLWARRHGDQRLKAILSDWPMERPAGWVRLVNEPMTEKEVDAIRACVARNRPYGNQQWQDQQAKRLGLLHTLRCEGRPRAIKGGQRPIN
jgi:putative transposase